jgi:hypothetical protein
MDLVVKENFVLHERRISLSEFHSADEVWYLQISVIYFLKVACKFMYKPIWSFNWRTIDPNYLVMN